MRWPRGRVVNVMPPGLTQARLCHERGGNVSQCLTRQGSARVRCIRLQPVRVTKIEKTIPGCYTRIWYHVKPKFNLADARAGWIRCYNWSRPRLPGGCCIAVPSCFLVLFYLSLLIGFIVTLYSQVVYGTAHVNFTGSHDIVSPLPSIQEFAHVNS
jgi:hypothetical protein